MSNVAGSQAGALDVHVVTPEGEVWSGPARFVVARALEGELGLLPGHEPMLAVLREGPLKVETGAGDVTATVEGGFLSVSSNDGVTRVDVMAEAIADVAGAS